VDRVSREEFDALASRVRDIEGAIRLGAIQGGHAEANRERLAATFADERHEEPPVAGALPLAGFLERLDQLNDPTWRPPGMGERVMAIPGQTREDDGEER